MRYFGDYINEFLAEAEVVRGSVIDLNKIRTRMASDEVLSDMLCDGLNKVGDSDYFLWRGEMISLAGGSITSNTRDSQLCQFYAMDLDKEAGRMVGTYKKMLATYKKVRALEAGVIGDMFSRFDKKSYFKINAIRSLDNFLNTFKTAMAHALGNRNALTVDGEDLISAYFKGAYDAPRFNDDQWVNDKLCLGAIAEKFVGDFDIDEVNRSYFKSVANVFVYDFCRKRDFKAFAKFQLSDVSYCNIHDKVDVSDTTRNFDKVAFAITRAFSYQKDFDSAQAMRSFDVDNLLKLDLGECQSNGGIKITRRKHLFEITLTHKLAQTLQIFLLKFNREKMVSNAA